MLLAGSFGIRCSAFLLACRRNRQFARGGKPNPTWRDKKGVAKETGGAFLAPPAHRNDCASGVPVDAAREVRVVLLFLRHRQVHIGSVRRATVVVAFGEDRRRRTGILTDQSAHVTEPLTARDVQKAFSRNRRSTRPAAVPGSTRAGITGDVTVPSVRGAARSALRIGSFRSRRSHCRRRAALRPR